MRPAIFFQIHARLPGTEFVLLVAEAAPQIEVVSRDRGYAYGAGGGPLVVAQECAGGVAAGHRSPPRGSPPYYGSDRGVAGGLRSGLPRSDLPKVRKNRKKALGSIARINRAGMKFQ